MPETESQFSLEVVKAAVREDRVSFGKSRATLKLIELVGGILEGRRFACALALELSTTDFCETVELRGGIRHDVYGVCAPEELLESYGVGLRAWYFKVTVAPGTWGDEVYFLSVHPLEHPMRRAGGWLSPAGEEEER